MSSPIEPKTHRRVPVVRLAVVVGLLALTITAMVLSSGQMADLRQAVPQLSHALNILEGVNLPVDMDHVALFGGLAFALRLLFPHRRGWWIALGLLVLAASTEVMQFAVAGRTPRWLDLRDDVIGMAIGLVAGAMLIAAWRWLQRQRTR